MDDSGLRDTFRALLGALRSADVEFAIIGALARGAWAEPRATTDLDVQIATTQPGWSSTIRALESAGFRLIRETPPVDPADPVPDQAFFRWTNGVRADLLVAKTRFETQALERRVTMTVLGEPVPVVTREDLIVYKTLAGRPRDVADVVALIEAARVGNEAIDWSYVEAWCSEWSVSQHLAEIRRLATD